MKLIEDLKNLAGETKLLREARANAIKREFNSLDHAVEVGIIYNGINRDDELIVHKYASDLRAQGKKVFLMGYVDLPTLPGNKKFTLQSEYCWKEKLTPFNLPDKGKIGRFLDIQFDLLLNIYTEPLLPMKALSAYAKAKYRVGPVMNHGTDYLDAMIDTKQQSNLKLLIEQIDFYLRSINSI